MMPLACLGSPQDTLTDVVVSSLKWIKLGALGAFGGERKKRCELDLELRTAEHFCHHLGADMSRYDSRKQKYTSQFHRITTIYFI